MQLHFVVVHSAKRPQPSLSLSLSLSVSRFPLQGSLAAYEWGFEKPPWQHQRKGWLWSLPASLWAVGMTAFLCARLSMRLRATAHTPKQTCSSGSCLHFRPCFSQIFHLSKWCRSCRQQNWPANYSGLLQRDLQHWLVLAPFTKVPLSSSSSIYLVIVPTSFWWSLLFERC